jgi:D-sedoheptulose 7-phosphate isomerase
VSTLDSDIGSRWLLELDQAASAVEAIRGSLDQVERVADVLVGVLRQGGCVFACGNGGSALAAQHFAAELVAHFRRDRPPLRGLALTADPGVLTAIANDFEYDAVFSRQVQALGTVRDALLAFSTSGTSPNVLGAVRAAREIGMVTVGFCGGDGGELGRLTDHTLVIPIAETARVQEGNLTLIHLICEHIDAEFEGG